MVLYKYIHTPPPRVANGSDQMSPTLFHSMVRPVHLRQLTVISDVLLQNRPQGIPHIPHSCVLIFSCGNSLPEDDRSP